MNILMTASEDYSDDNCVLVTLESIVREACGEEVNLYLQEDSALGRIVTRLCIEGAADEGIVLWHWSGLWGLIERVFGFIQEGRDDWVPRNIARVARRRGIPTSYHYDTLSVSH